MAIGEVFHDCMWSGVCACCPEAELHGTTTVVVKPTSRCPSTSEVSTQLHQEATLLQTISQTRTSSGSATGGDEQQLAVTSGLVSGARVDGHQVSRNGSIRLNEGEIRGKNVKQIDIQAGRNKSVPSNRAYYTNGGALSSNSTTSTISTSTISNTTSNANSNTNATSATNKIALGQAVTITTSPTLHTSSTRSSSNAKHSASGATSKTSQSQGGNNSGGDYSLAAKKLRHREVEKNRHRQLQAMVKTLSEKIPGRVDKETQVQTMRRAARYCVFLRDVLAAAAHGQMPMNRDRLEKLYLRSCENVELIMSQQDC